jgi:hypothetical protein
MHQHAQYAAVHSLHSENSNKLTSNCIKRQIIFTQTSQPHMKEYKAFEHILSKPCSQIPTEHIFMLTSAKKDYFTFPETGCQIISLGRTASDGRLLRRSSAMASSICSGVSLSFGLQSCKEKFAIVRQQCLLTK